MSEQIGDSAKVLTRQFQSVRLSFVSLGHRAVIRTTESANMAARVGKLAAESTSFFVCDLQERFRTAIVHFPEIVEVGRRLVAAAKILNIQTIVTEQNPKGACGGH